MPADPIAQIRENEHTATGSGGVFQFVVPGWSGSGLDVALAPSLPSYWSWGRDVAIRSTVYAESMWDTAVGIAMAQVAAQSWEIQSDRPLKSKQAKDMLSAINFPAFLMKQVRDYLLTDNGCFYGIERESSNANSRVVSLYHLDSARCLRTGDTDTPVIYRDKRNRYYNLKSHQVVMLCDEPDPAEIWNGVGHCAGSRAYKRIYSLSGIETYLTEKVTGRRPLTIYLVNGITETQLANSIKTAQEQAAQKGSNFYMGALMISLLGDAPASVVPIPLSELPSGFDANEERRNAQLTYANALGLDPQDINPELLAKGGLGQGTQSKVLDDKAKGKALAVFKQQFSWSLNEFVFPDTVRWYFVENDLRDQKAQADISKLRADTRSVQKMTGEITSQQALQMAVDSDDAPAEFLIDDTVADRTVAEQDKPDAMKPDQEAMDNAAQALQDARAIAAMPQEQAEVIKEARALTLAIKSAERALQSESVKSLGGGLVITNATMQLPDGFTMPMEEKEMDTQLLVSLLSDAIIQAAKSIPPAVVTVNVPVSPAPIVNVAPANVTVKPVIQLPPEAPEVEEPKYKVSKVLRNSAGEVIRIETTES